MCLGMWSRRAFVSPQPQTGLVIRVRVNAPGWTVGVGFWPFGLGRGGTNSPPPPLPSPPVIHTHHGAHTPYGGELRT